MSAYPSKRETELSQMLRGIEKEIRDVEYEIRKPNLHTQIRYAEELSRLYLKLRGCMIELRDELGMKEDV